MSGSSSSGGVMYIGTMKDLMKCVENEKSNLMVLEFMAPWSEPCKYMEKPYQEVASSEEFRKKKVKFAAVNIDKFQDLGRGLGVEAMPAFLMIKNYMVVDEIVALDKNELSKKIKETLDNS